MQPKKQSYSQSSGRKGVATRINSQANQPSQPQQSSAGFSNNPHKERDDALLTLVKEFLEKNGYPKALQALKTERPVKRVPSTANKTPSSKHLISSQEDEKAVMQVTLYLTQQFDKGHREEFFRLTSKMFSQVQSAQVSENYLQGLRKLEF